MITPNKVITLRESALGKVPIILGYNDGPIDLLHLYQGVSKQFESVDQFLLAMDILFVIGKINVNFETRVVAYAD